MTKTWLWTISNGTWFVYNGQTFLKLYGGPRPGVYCYNTGTVIRFQDTSILVEVR